MTRAAALAALLWLPVPAPGQGEKPTRVEVGKRGKAATAFVDVPGRGTGTAFCVHPSGLFVTNEHVVRGAGEVTVVLHPSLDDQRVLKAKVVRADRDLDLALLRADGAKDLPSLPLGSAKGVAELADVVACGFPLGRALSPDKKEYPAVSVNAGGVTALRQKGGELLFFQIDIALTYGSSGGPVLDEHGKVIGVVVSGAAGGGKGINQAIPVSRLDKFLRAPDVALVPPELTRDALGKPLEFKARVVSFLPDAPDPDLKLILRAGDGEPREFPMKKTGGVWAATAPPAAPAGPALVVVTVRLGSGTVTGLTGDAVFTVGGKPVRLSGVRRVELGPKPGVLLADGRTAVEGAVAGLGAAEIDLGGQAVRLDLAKATQLTVEPAPEVVTVTATVVAATGGKEVARAETRIPVRDPARAGPADPSVVPITPPALAGEKVVKRLPEGFTEVAVGGGGRYLIFHMPRLKKLAVFDVSEARVTKYIPLTEDDITFAAGLDAVVVGLKKAGKLERWSLTTADLESSAAPPFREDIQSVVMGHGSNGPVVVNGYFLDPGTFRQLPVVNDQRQERIWAAAARPVPSGDGTVFGLWGTTGNAYVLEGGEVRRYEGGGRGHVVPGPDGRAVFTAKGVASRTLKYADAEDATYGYCLPAVRGDYFLSVTPAPTPGKGGGFTAYLRGLKQPIAKLDKADHGLNFDSAGGDPHSIWRRVFLVPDAKVIAVLPASNDQVVLFPFEPEAALEKSGLDYLLVTSSPPREAKAGATLTYPVRVKSKQGGVAFTLDSGPKGMAVSPAGVVTWAVPADAPDGQQDVILTVRDKTGQEVFHTFPVRVTK